jgi:hypothetical protein
MKTILKLTACLAFFGAVTTVSAQQKATTTTKDTKKQTSKKSKTGIDNKIAVSDQAQPTDKNSKGTKKESGISNK